jgi:hypothetical protein
MNYRICFLYCFNRIFMFACNSKKPVKTHRIFYINSYHAGYGSSDDVMEGITETLASENVELKIYFHDAKRKTADPEIQQSVKDALKKLKSLNLIY